jgi:DNA-3-methyladenine glycosylase
LVRKLPEGAASGRIVETEAYVVGEAARRTYRGWPRRNRSLFLERGHAYIYLAYGSSCMLNVSSDMPGIGAAVLIRVLEPLEGIQIMRLNRGIERLRDLARGPGRPLRLCGLIVGSLDSIFAMKALFGSDTVTTNPAKSGRALGSAFHGTEAPPAIFIRSSAVQDRSRNKRPPQSPSSSLERESGFEARFLRRRSRLPV